MLMERRGVPDRESVSRIALRPVLGALACKLWHTLDDWGDLVLPYLRIDVLFALMVVADPTSRCSIDA